MTTFLFQRSHFAAVAIASYTHRRYCACRGFIIKFMWCRSILAAAATIAITLGFKRSKSPLLFWISLSNFIRTYIETKRSNLQIGYSTWRGVRILKEMQPHLFGLLCSQRLCMQSASSWLVDRGARMLVYHPQAQWNVSVLLDTPANFKRVRAVCMHFPLDIRAYWNRSWPVRVVVAATTTTSCCYLWCTINTTASCATATNNNTATDTITGVAIHPYIQLRSRELNLLRGGLAWTIHTVISQVR